MAWWHLVLVGVTLSLAAAVNVGCGGGVLLSFAALSVGLPPHDANIINLILLPVSFAGGLLVAARSVALAATAPGTDGTSHAHQHRSPAEHGSKLATLAPSLVAAVASAGGAAALVGLPAGHFAAAAPWLTIIATVVLAASPLLRRLGGEATRPIGQVMAIVPVGVYGGFFGPGVGPLLTTVIMMTNGGSHHQRVHDIRRQVSLGMSISAAAVLGLTATVAWPVVLVLAPCAFLGGVIGTRIASRCSEPALRWSAVGVGATSAASLWLA